jgi:hypothetical protein
MRSNYKQRVSNTHSTQANASSTAGWKNLSPRLNKNLPVTGFLRYSLFSHRRWRKIELDPGVDLGRFAIGTSLAEDTSSSCKVRAPAIGATQEIGFVNSDVLSLELCNRVCDIDRVRSGNEG